VKLKRLFTTLIWAVPLLLLLLLVLFLSSVTIEKYQIRKEVPVKKKDVMSGDRK